MFVLVLCTTVVALSLAEASFDECPSVTYNLSCPWKNVCYDDFGCHCDDLCDLHNDCCPEYLPNITLNYRHDLKISCKETGLSSSYISIVDSCPSTVNDMTRKVCEDASVSQSLFSKLPVSDKNGLLFKNVYCAACNDLQADGILYWKAKINCHEEGQINFTEVHQALRSGECFLDYEPPNYNIYTRKCSDDIIKTCPLEYKENKCTKFHCEKSNFVRNVYGNNDMGSGNVYKNEHCAKCNEALKSEDQGWPFMEACGLYRIEGLSDDLNSFFPISIIIDINPSGGGKVGFQEYGRTVNETQSQTCDPGYLFDVLQNECVLVYCKPGLTPVGNICLSSIDESYTDCIRHVLSRGDYELFENGTVVNNMGQMFNISQYEDFGNGTIGVCISGVETKVVLKFDNAQTIFSIVGQCISIICLIIHLTVYSILPQLRNPPGKALMALVASLLAAQVLFLIGVGRTDPHELCVAIGILIHYSFLASFFWMAVMSFDICMTFSDSRATDSSRDRNKKFIKYCIAGFGCPLMIVAISLILNYTHGVPENIRPGYGEGLCWIVNRTSLIIFFGVPIFSIVCINMLFYIVTLRALYKISKATKCVQKDKSERQRFSLYVKLSIIMGLTWLFGIVAVFVDNDVLWYVFLFFNTLQGAFICVSFIFTKKVISLLKGKFAKSLPFITETTGTDSTKSTDISRRSKAIASPDIPMEKAGMNTNKDLT